MIDIQYVRATDADIEKMIQCRIDFFVELSGPQTNEAINQLKENLKQYFAKALNDNSYICWLAKTGDEIVGAGGIVVREHPGNFVNLSGKTGYVMSMYTSPMYRKRGICSTILNNLLESAKELGIRNFELHATQKGEPVYIANGFLLHKEPTYRKHTEG